MPAIVAVGAEVGIGAGIAETTTAALVALGGLGAAASLLSNIDGQDTFSLLYDAASGLVDALTFNTSEWFQNGDGFQGYWQGEKQGPNVETLPIFDIQSKTLITPLPNQDWPTILAIPMPRDADLAGWQDGGFTPAPEHFQPQTLSTPIPSQQDLYRGMILERSYGTHGELVYSKKSDSHHIIQDAAVRDIDGYSRYNAPAVQLKGPSVEKGTEHYNATQTQREAGGGSYAAERRIAYKSLRKAGLNKKESKFHIERADKYFEEIGVEKRQKTRIPGNRKSLK